MAISGSGLTEAALWWDDARTRPRPMRQLTSMVSDAHHRLAVAGKVDWVSWAMYPQMARGTAAYPTDLPFSLSWSPATSDSPSLKVKFLMQGDIFLAGGTSHSTLTTLRALDYSQLRLICEKIVEFRDFR